MVDRLPFVGSVKRDVKGLRALLYERRAARVVALGRHGSGRTALANALLAQKALPTDAPISQGEWIRVDAAGSRLDWLELGAGSLDAVRFARALGEARPDVLLLCVTPADLADLGPLLDTSSAVLARLEANGEGRPPFVALLTRVDEIPPVAHASPWPAEKESAIELGRQRLERALAERGSLATQTIAVSAPGGDALVGIDALAGAIFQVLPEAARIESARALPAAPGAKREVAAQIVQACSTLALTVGLAPVPLSDAFLIAPLQVVMVSSIAHLGGRTWDRKALLEWMASMGVVGGAGLGFRWAAQQLVKLVPGAGYVISAGVAGAGTATLGQSAVAYFLRDAPRELPRDVAAASS